MKENLRRKIPTNRGRIFGSFDKYLNKNPMHPKPIDKTYLTKKKISGAKTKKKYTEWSKRNQVSRI